MLGDSGYSHESEESLIAAFLAHRPCGLVLHDTTHGFDDWEISRRFAIPITTLDIPRYKIGEKAAKLMLRRLDDERGKLPPIDVGFRIIERAST